MVLGAIFKDREKDEKKDGVFWSPWHPNFGDIRLGGITVASMSGRLKPFGMLVKLISPKWIAEEKSSEGHVEWERATGAKKIQLLTSYLQNRLSPSLDFLVRLTILREFRKGGDLGTMGNAELADRILQESISNMIASDAIKLAEKYSPAEAVGVMTLATGGWNVSIWETGQEREDRKNAEKERSAEYYSLHPINEE